jgi:hypothetical protein
VRVRTDAWMVAGWKRAASLGVADVAGSIRKSRTPVARLGDVWVVRFVASDDPGITTTVRSAKGPIVGYALTCPNEACTFGVHDWTWTNNCDQKLPKGSRCAHMRDRTSCWTWTGSPADGTLSASPSLHSPTDLGGCGWHGHLRNGQMEPA